MEMGELKKSYRQRIGGNWSLMHLGQRVRVTEREESRFGHAEREL